MDAAGDDDPRLFLCVFLITMCRLQFEVPADPPSQPGAKGVSIGGGGGGGGAKGKSKVCVLDMAAFRWQAIWPS